MHERQVHEGQAHQSQAHGDPLHGDPLHAGQARKDGSSGAMPSSRMEAFSDGVIAVVVTIMVLELHVPPENGVKGFLLVVPRIGIYILSYFMVGIYWINHHELLRRIETIDTHVLWANLIYLLALSLLPFCTAYAGEKHFDSFSALLYTGAMLLAAVTFFGLRHAVMQLQKRDGRLAPQHRTEANKHIASLSLYLTAVPLSFRYPHITFALDTAVTLLWILPGLGTRRGLSTAVNER